MTRNAWNILEAGGPEAYPRALAALREDTRVYWQECLSRPDGGLAYAPTADMLKAWIDRHWKECDRRTLRRQQPRHYPIFVRLSVSSHFLLSAPPKVPILFRRQLL